MMTFRFMVTRPSRCIEGGWRGAAWRGRSLGLAPDLAARRSGRDLDQWLGLSVLWFSTHERSLRGERDRAWPSEDAQGIQQGDTASTRQGRTLESSCPLTT